MIHERKDYNKRIQDSERIISIDEPVFLLRAQDDIAPNILREYAVRAKNRGLDELADRVWSHIELMVKWRSDNTKKTKLPDSPKQQSLNFK